MLGWVSVACNQITPTDIEIDAGPGKLFPHLSSTCRTIKAVVRSTMKLSSQNRELSPHRCRAHAIPVVSLEAHGVEVTPVSPLATR